MGNRSHRNPGHRGMNFLRKKGIAHSSVADISVTALPHETVHVFAISDCLELLRDIPNNSIQLIVCDPPYNINVAQWDTVHDYVDWAGQWLAEVRRVPKPSGNFVLFGGLQ